MAEDEKKEGLETELTLEEVLGISAEELDKFFTARRLRLQNPWVLDLIKVLYPHPRGISRSIVLHTVQKNRANRGHEPIETPEEAIQSAYNRFCVDSAVFRKRKTKWPDEGMFHSPRGPGAGVWAIYQDKAQAWLKRHGLRP